MTPKKLFQLFATAEVFTWGALITGLVLRATVGVDSLAFTIVGGIHGAAFLAYGTTAVLVAVNNRWKFGRAALAVILAIVPFATLPFELWLKSKGHLDGDWRREHSGHPRDDHWFDRLYRWFLNRPVLLAAALVLAVILIFVTLLLIGPPGGSKD